MHKTEGGLVAGTLFVLPGLLAIMALELDLRPARQGHDRAGPVLRPQGRRAGDRDRGGAARRQARAQEQRHARRWPPRPSSRSSSTTCRSRSIILVAGLARLRRRTARLCRRSSPAVATARSATSRWPTPTRCSARRRPRMPGRTSAGRSPSAAAVPGAVAGAGGGCSTSALGGDNVFTQIARVLQQDGGGHLRRRLCGAGLRGAAGGRYTITG